MNRGFKGEGANAVEAVVGRLKRVVRKTMDVLRYESEEI